MVPGPPTQPLQRYVVAPGEGAMTMARALALVVDPTPNHLRHAHHWIAQYEQHFADRPRATRDARRLNEIIEHLDLQSRDAPGPLDRTRGSQGIARVTSALRREYRQVITAYQDGNPERRACALMMRASEQFMVYRHQFAGHARLSCRPALLGRVIANLEDILAGISDPVFREPSDPGMHDANRAIIVRALGDLRLEHIALEEAHRLATDDERSAALVAAAGPCMSSDAHRVLWGEPGPEPARATDGFRTPAGDGRSPSFRDALRDRVFELELQLIALPLGEAIRRCLEQVQDRFERMSAGSVWLSRRYP